MDLWNPNSLLHQGFLAVLLLLVATGALYVALAQNKSRALGAAVGRSFSSFFTSPWGYLRKTIGELALGQENPRLRDTDHYLLNRLIRNAQVGLLVGVVLGGGFLITMAVYSMLPPPELRENLATAQDQAAQAQTTASQTENAVKQQDQDWQNRRAELIKNAQDNGRQKIRTLQDSLAADERDLQANPETERVMPNLRTFLQAHQGDPSAAEEAKEFIQRLPSLSESQAAGLSTYCDHWAALQSASVVAPENADAIRGKFQPDHSRLVEELESQKRLRHKRKAVLRNWKKKSRLRISP
jgi:gas vesicle protein